MNIEDTQLVLIDVQGKLAEIIDESEKTIKNICRLVSGCRLLEIPVLWLEQNPEKLGPTVPEIAELLKDIQPVSKMSFSAYRNDVFRTRLEEHQRRNILMTGIETHICVYQTAADLIDAGYQVNVGTEAVSSRTKENGRLGIEKIKERGGCITGTEMALFELLKTCENENFRAVSKLIK